MARAVEDKSKEEEEEEERTMDDRRTNKRNYCSIMHSGFGLLKPLARDPCTKVRGASVFQKQKESTESHP